MKFTNINHVVMIMFFSISIVSFAMIKYKPVGKIVSEKDPPKRVWNKTNYAEGSVSEINKSMNY